MEKYSKDREIAFLKEKVKTLEMTRPTAEWCCTLEQMVSARDQQILELQANLANLQEYMAINAGLFSNYSNNLIKK